MNRQYPISPNRTNFTSDDYIHLNSCGKTIGTEPDFITYRPSGRIDWQILYQIEGTFTAEYDGKEITVTPGDILIYPPNMPQVYVQPSGSQTWWIHFTGTAVESILSSLGLLYGMKRGTLDSLIVETFRRLCGLSGADYASVTVQNANLLMLLGFLSRNAVGQIANLGENLAPAIQLMREEYTRHITIPECAAACRMSESSFKHQFRENVGIAPLKFLKDVRMEKACDLLMYTTLSISRIAELCGYNDSLYFSKQFRKKYGVSPNTWRK